MTTFEVLSLMIGFGSLIVLIISCCRNMKQSRETGKPDFFQNNYLIEEGRATTHQLSFF